MIGTRSKELSTQIRKRCSPALTRLRPVREQSGTEQSRNYRSLSSLTRQYNLFLHSVSRYGLMRVNVHVKVIKTSYVYEIMDAMHCANLT